MGSLNYALHKSKEVSDDCLETMRRTTLEINAILADDSSDDELESELIALAAGRGALTWAAVTCNARPALYAATKALAAVSLLPASGASNAARGVPMKNWDLE